MDDKTISELAKVAEIDLDSEARAGLAPRLKGLLEDANRVNTFMASRRTVGPSVRFKHVEPLDDGNM